MTRGPGCSARGRLRAEGLGSSEKSGGLGGAVRDDPDELISRIEGLLDDDEPLDDWAYPWSDSWRWAPPEVGLPEGVWDDQADEPLEGGWDYYPPAEIHVIPVEQVDEWMACLDTMPTVEREDVQWYVVCFTCMTAGERSVDCGCGNPSPQGDSR